jgi:hypothetical protein
VTLTDGASPDDAAPSEPGSAPRSLPGSRGLVIASATLAILLLAAPIPSLIEAFSRPAVNGYGGIDYRLYMDATQRWLDGGPFYQPYQLEGPYTITPGDILYPPVALWLFVPFTFLPAALWWIVPIGVVSAVVLWLRPAPIAWPVIALCIAWPATQVKLITGNPVIWAVAAMALGCIYRWPSVFVLIKPSLFPFALFGIHRRSWWIGLAVFAALCLPFGAMWVDWLTTVVNSREGGLIYSIQEVPMLLLPLAAWWWRTRPDAVSETTSLDRRRPASASPQGASTPGR